MRVSCVSELFERCSKVMVDLPLLRGGGKPLCYRLKRDRMARWVHTVALLVIAAVLANAQCFASCFTSGSDNMAGQHSACCTEHHSPQKQSKSGCQYKHSDLKNAELGDTDSCKALAVSWHSDAIAAAVVSIAFHIHPTAFVPAADLTGGTPPRHSVFSVLRI